LSRLDLGAFAVAAALAVAAVKAALVMACFMRLKDEERLLWLVAGSGFVWLAVLVVAILDELNSRSWLPP
ncbi:MAG: cytochrome C oxidase subunit IV family protein, partial [Elusimicrobia bacterium]|nr:cytochrome C oxidase subunit IV family protein [Elusimicrobiota bacterium]